MTQAIPIIDLRDIYDDSALPRIAAELRDVYSEVGFGSIINHGISSESRQQILALAKAFHALPMAEKLNLKAGKYLKGYVPPSSYSLRKSGLGESAPAPNVNDSFVIMRELEEPLKASLSDTCYGGSTPWPESLPDMHAIAFDYIDKMSKLSARLVQAFALAIGLEKNDLQYLLKPQPMNTLRLLRYFAEPSSPSENAYGIAPHSDNNFISLISQDDVGGLQVRTPDGKDWLDVAPKPNLLILNSGDMLMRLSNGLIRSTPHRVICPSERERHSQAFFVAPAFDETIAPVAPCVENTEGGAIYPPITFREYMAEMFANNYVGFDKN